MLTEQELIGYLENTLSSADRQRVEAELERDPQLRRQLVQHAQLEQALRATFADASANDRVKQSVLAILRGGTEGALKQKVLADTQPRELPANSKPPLIWEKAFSFLQEIISGGYELAGQHRWVAACGALLCFGLAVWLLTASLQVVQVIANKLLG